METLASILESLASKAAGYMADTTVAQLSHLFKHDSKFQNFLGKVQELKDARQRVQQSVDEAKRNGEKIFDDVERWLTVVNEKISDQATTQSQEDEKKEMENYFAGFLLGIKNRYQLSKKADEEAEAITQLLNEKDRFDRVSYRPTLEVTDIMRPVKEYEAFGSRNGAFDGVMVALEDDNVNITECTGWEVWAKPHLSNRLPAKSLPRRKSCLMKWSWLL